MSDKNKSSYQQKLQKLINGTPKRHPEVILNESKDSLLKKKKDVLKRMKFLGTNFEA